MSATFLLSSLVGSVMACGGASVVWAKEVRVMSKKTAVAVLRMG